MYPATGKKWWVCGEMVIQSPTLTQNIFLKLNLWTWTKLTKNIVFKLIQNPIKYVFVLKLDILFINLEGNFIFSEF